MNRYEKHIGEFIREKLKKKGITQSSLSRKMNMQPQNFQQRILDKNELVPSMLQELMKHLGDDFFSEFFDTDAESVYSLNDRKEEYRKSKTSKGFKIFIEVDPDNFDSSDADRLSSSIHELIKKFK